MRNVPFISAQADLGGLVDCALAGEHQRIVLPSGETVIVVAETTRPHPKAYPTLIDLIIATVGAGDEPTCIGDRSWFKDERPLGQDFADWGEES